MKARNAGRKAKNKYPNLKNWIILFSIIAAVALAITLAVILTREEDDPKDKIGGITPDLSEYMTLSADAYTTPTVDLGAFLADRGINYNDIWDVPSYLSEYKAQLFWTTLKDASTVRFNDVPEIYKQGKTNAITLEIQTLYTAYLTECGQSGTPPEFADVSAFAADYFDYGNDFETFEEYASFRANDLLREEMVLHCMLKGLGRMPTEKEIQANYDRVIAEAALTDEQLKTIKEDYGEGYLWDKARNDLMLTRALDYVNKNWIFQTPEVSPESAPAFDKSEIDPTEYVKTETRTDLVQVEVRTKDNSISGSFYIRLYANAAPITVQAFQKMVENGAYNNVQITTAHAINIMTSAPTGTDLIKGEFYDNGLPNHLPHEERVVSMFHSGGNDSAKGQFFIVLSGNYQDSLNGFFASFGYVVAGWDVVKEIAAAPVGANNQLVSPVSMSISFVEKMDS